MNTDSPLNEQHLSDINRGLEAARAGLAQVQLAESAGIDMSAMKQQLLDSQSQLLKLKQVYFPGR